MRRMKTPEEIKKGLECCGNTGCNTCPYFLSCPPHYSQSATDALDYIKQLEEREKNLYAAIHAVMRSIDKWLDVEPYDFDEDDGTVAATRASNAREIALNAIEKAEQERDAALKDIANTCWSCRNAKPSQLSKFLYSCPHLKGKSGVRTQCENWQWRGVCPENTKENTK